MGIMDECGAWLNWKLIDLAMLHLVRGGAYFRSPHTFKKATDAFFNKRLHGATTSPVCAESGVDQVMFPSHRPGHHFKANVCVQGDDLRMADASFPPASAWERAAPHI